MSHAQLPPPGALPERARGLLEQLGVDLARLSADGLRARTPITGETIATLRGASPQETGRAIEQAHSAFLAWRTVPPPVRGAVVGSFGQMARKHKAALGELISIETGKILSEGLGEVQELIDMCDFAVGLSRQLYGLTIASERPGHRMMETWHPLGVCGVVTAFNFPVAVLAAQSAIVKQETFAPILYVMAYRDMAQAIEMQNDVPQGLASSIFTKDLTEAEWFLAAAGSDCGIANVNIGPSGAEIGGAFGGEKQTGGGREAGSDAWKAYMRRATNTINYSNAVPLAQGVKFDID